MVRQTNALPTTSSLPNSRRLPSTHPAVIKALLKLSRSSLISLCQEWLENSHLPSCHPVLASSNPEEAVYEAAQDVEELQEIYEDFRSRKGSKREVVDRIVEGDWRNGISLRQLAMLDVKHLQDHPTSQRWTALKLVRTEHSTESAPSSDTKHSIPRFHGPTLLRNMQKEVGSILRAHYHLSRLDGLPMTLLRIYIHDLPYLNGNSIASDGPLDASKIMYVAFPDNTPAIYVSLANMPGVKSGSDGKSIRKILIDALPKAFSRVRERYTLTATSLSTRALSSLIALRGPGGGNAAAGGWSIYADGTADVDPLMPFPHVDATRDDDEIDDKENDESPGTKRKRLEPNRSSTINTKECMSKRRKALAKGRFGESAIDGDGKGIERLDIRMEDAFSRTILPSHASESLANGEASSTQATRKRRRNLSANANDSDDEPDDASLLNGREWCPKVRLTFHGTHVFAGVRKLVERGVVDGERMPGWMSGENGVSTGVVRHGRIRGHKGADL